MTPRSCPDFSKKSLRAISRQPEKQQTAHLFKNDERCLPRRNSCASGCGWYRRSTLALQKRNHELPPEDPSGASPHIQSCAELHYSRIRAGRPEVWPVKIISRRFPKATVASPHTDPGANTRSDK